MSGAPADVWHTLQQSIGNAAIGRMRRVQHQALDEDATPVDETTQGQIEASRDNGRPLTASVQQQMAPHFGPDVEDVRVHDDAEAGSMAKDLHARAFTQGRDVYFAPGQYAPESDAGRDVLAHELTHVTRGTEHVGVVHCAPDNASIPMPFAPGQRFADEGPQMSLADPGGGVSAPADFGASEGGATREVVGGVEYAATTAMEWQLGGNEMIVTVPINFVGAPPASRWFPEIRATWNHFELVNTDTGERVILTFVPEASSSGYTVTVVDGKGRANESTWYLGDARTTTAPHEFGHMLGLQDEYQVTREHYEGITGQEAPAGDELGGAGTIEDTAFDLSFEISNPGADQADRIYKVVTDNGIQQGEYAQMIKDEYDLSYGNLIQDLVAAQTAAPDDPDEEPDLLDDRSLQLHLRLDHGRRHRPRPRPRRAAPSCAALCPDRPGRVRRQLAPGAGVLMMRHHAPEATQVEDAPASTPSQRFDAPDTAQAPWQTLQGSIGNAAVGRLLNASPSAPAGYVQRLPEDEAPLSDEAAATDTGEIGAGIEGGGGEAEEMKGGASTKRTKEQAVALVDKHVEPKDCFVWYENNKVGWAPMPGTGCAHWVAHQLNFTDGLKCDKGFTVRVRNITASRAKVEMKDVKVGDLWENPTDASHIGIIRSVNQTDGKVTGVEVEHDSVRSGGVVKSTFTEGLFYR